MTENNEHLESLVLRDTLKMALMIADGCSTVEEFKQKIKDILDDKR